MQVDTTIYASIFLPAIIVIIAYFLLIKLVWKQHISEAEFLLTSMCFIICQFVSILILYLDAFAHIDALFEIASVISIALPLTLSSAWLNRLKNIETMENIKKYIDECQKEGNNDKCKIYWRFQKDGYEVFGYPDDHTRYNN